MPSHSTALSAARSSRGYLFTVVACSVLLAAQAAIQWVREAQADVPLANSGNASPPEGDTQPADLEQAISDAEDRVATAESALATAALQQATAAAELEELNSAAERLRTEIGRLEGEVADARRAPDEAGAAATPEPVQPAPQQDDEVMALETSLAELRSQLAELLTRFTYSHPVVQDVDRQIAEASARLQKLRSAPPPDTPTNGDESLNAADKAQLAIEAKLKAAQQELGRTNTARDEKALALADIQQEMERQAQDKERAEAELARLEGLRQPAEQPPPTPDDPPPNNPHNPRQIEAFSLLFSLTLGCLLGCVAYVRAKPVNQKITSRSDVESVLALPLIGLLPGTDDSSLPPPVPDAPRPTRVRLIAELTIATFAAANVAAVALVEGHSQRLTGQPLSAFADGVRVIVENVFA